MLCCCNKTQMQVSCVIAKVKHKQNIEWFKTHLFKYLA